MAADPKKELVPPELRILDAVRCQVVQHLDSFVHSFILDSLSTIDTFHQGVDRFSDAEWESSFL